MKLDSINLPETFQAAAADSSVEQPDIKMAPQVAPYDMS